MPTLCTVNEMKAWQIGSRPAVGMPRAVRHWLTPLQDAGFHVVSCLAPGGTKVTIACLARVSNTRQAFFRYCRR